MSSVKSDLDEQATKTKLQAVGTERGAEDKARETGKKAEEITTEAKKKAIAAGKEAKKEAKAASKKLQDNRDNPVLIANGVIIVVGAAALAFGTYKTHSEGKLDWPLAGTIIAAVGAFSVADYFASK